MGITKNNLSNETIMNIFAQNFPNQKIEQIKELTEGMFNVAYSVSFEDGSGAGDPGQACGRCKEP